MIIIGYIIIFLHIEWENSIANFRKHNRNHIEMKTMCINDFVAPAHQARIIVSIVEKLDLTSFDSWYKNDECCNVAYPIIEMLSVLIYASLR